MPQGLQVWNANGQITLDTSTSVGRVIGAFSVAANSTGSTTITLAAGERLWAALAANSSSAYNRLFIEVPGAIYAQNINGNIIRWQVQSAGLVIYGAY